MKYYYHLLTIVLFSAFSAGNLMAQVNISNGSTTACADSLYDSGGQTGSYAVNENFEFTISPTGASDITISIDSINIAAGDTLRIHDGTDTLASVIHIFTDTSVFIPPVFNTSGGSVTVHFKSDNTTNDFGFKLHWSANLTAASVAVSKSVTNICDGDNVTFTATPANGGASPDYQWYVNGGTVGTNSTTYANNTLTNSDFVWVEMDADRGKCLTDSILFDSLQVTVTANTTSSVAVSKSVTTICSGDNVTFTATPTNEGASPDYQWYVNGSTVGTNSTSYANNSLNNNDYVWVEMRSDITTGCLIDSLSYDSLQVTVTANTTSSVAVSKSVTTICAGDNVTFTATPTNPGASPDYQWYVNGGTVGTNSTSYANNSLNNNDYVWVEMRSDIATGCLIDSLSYDSLQVTVNANVTASVAITGDPSFCDGTSVTYTAVPTNGGGSPTYNWTINGGGSVGTGTTYNTSTLNDGDDVELEMTSSINTGCLIDSVSQTTLTVNVNGNPSLSIGSVTNVVCYGDSTGQATASATGGNSPYSYSWTSGEMTAAATGL